MADMTIKRFREDAIMTAKETILKYLRGRKTGATVPEIVAATGLNPNTVRKIVGVWSWARRSRVLIRKCRITGKMLSAYVML